VLAGPREDVGRALEALADALGAGPGAPGHEAEPPALPDGALDPAAIGAALARLLPEGAVVVDESVTASAPIAAATAAAPPHDWLTLTGGAIGQGLPAATGAAVACPDRPVVCLEGDGSAMYTIQALWTQAREGLDVTNVILANRAYAILDFELSRVGASARGPAADALFGIGRPDLDFVAISEGLGVPARRVEDAPGFVAALGEALAEPGPHLIEARI
jgi:acetolactate synthase-1/2/3 large subunit